MLEYRVFKLFYLQPKFYLPLNWLWSTTSTFHLQKCKRPQAKTKKKKKKKKKKAENERKSWNFGTRKFSKKRKSAEQRTLIPLQLLKVSHLRNAIKSLASPAVLGLLIETCEMINDKNHFYKVNAIFLVSQDKLLQDTYRVWKNMGQNWALKLDWDTTRHRHLRANHPQNPRP